MPFAHSLEPNKVKSKIMAAKLMKKPKTKYLIIASLVSSRFFVEAICRAARQQHATAMNPPMIWQQTAKTFIIAVHEIRNRAVLAVNAASKQQFMGSVLRYEWLLKSKYPTLIIIANVMSKMVQLANKDQYILFMTFRPHPTAKTAIESVCTNKTSLRQLICSPGSFPSRF